MGTTNLFPTFKWSFRELEKYSGCYWLEFWVQTVVGTQSGCALGFLISFSWVFLPLCCCFLFGGIGRGNVKQFVRNVFGDKSQPIRVYFKTDYHIFFSPTTFLIQFCSARVSQTYLSEHWVHKVFKMRKQFWESICIWPNSSFPLLIYWYAVTNSELMKQSCSRYCVYCLISHSLSVYLPLAKGVFIITKPWLRPCF